MLVVAAFVWSVLAHLMLAADVSCRPRLSPVMVVGCTFTPRFDESDDDVTDSSTVGSERFLPCSLDPTLLAQPRVSPIDAPLVAIDSDADDALLFVEVQTEYSDDTDSEMQTPVEQPKRLRAESELATSCSDRRAMNHDAKAVDDRQYSVTNP